MISKESDYLFVTGEDKHDILYGKDVMPLRKDDAQNIFRGLDIVFLMEAGYERQLCTRLKDFGSVKDYYDRNVKFEITPSIQEVKHACGMSVPYWASSPYVFNPNSTISDVLLISESYPQYPLDDWIKKNGIQVPYPDVESEVSSIGEKKPILESFENIKQFTFFRGATTTAVRPEFQITSKVSAYRTPTTRTYSSLFTRSGEGNYDSLHDQWSYEEFELTMNPSNKAIFDENELPYLNKCRDIVRSSGEILACIEFSGTQEWGDNFYYFDGMKVYDIKNGIPTVNTLANDIYNFMRSKGRTESDGYSITDGSIGEYRSVHFDCEYYSPYILVRLGDHTRWWK